MKCIRDLDFEPSETSGGQPVALGLRFWPPFLGFD